MSVRGVWVESDIGVDAHIRIGLLDFLDRAGHKAIWIVRLFSIRIFLVVWNRREKDDLSHSKIDCLADLREPGVQREKNQGERRRSIASTVFFLIHIYFF